MTTGQNASSSHSSPSPASSAAMPLTERTHLLEHGESDHNPFLHPRRSSAWHRRDHRKLAISVGLLFVALCLLIVPSTRQGSRLFRSSSSSSVNPPTQTASSEPASTSTSAPDKPPKFSTDGSAFVEEEPWEDIIKHKYGLFFDDLIQMKDDTVDPCEDFYQYACGGWLSDNDIPSDRTSIDSSFFVVAERNREILDGLLHDKLPLISVFHDSCMDDQEIDQDSVSHIADIIHLIHHQTTTEDLMVLAGELFQQFGVDAFFTLMIGADPQDPSTNILQASQGGLTLPSREYYLEEGKLNKYSELFVNYVGDLFAVDGLDYHNISAFAGAILETEGVLAQISLPNADLRDPWTTSTKYTMEEIGEKFPYLALFLKGINNKQSFDQSKQVVIATPGFFERVTNFLGKIRTQHIKNYMCFHVIDQFANILGEYFRRASHEFHGALVGLGKLPSRKDFCQDMTASYLGEQLGSVYLNKVFTEDDREMAQTLIDEIESSMKTVLETESWLDQPTYQAALDKLANVNNLIGGPRTVANLPFELKSDTFCENVLQIRQHESAKAIQLIGKGVDHKRWDMFSFTVNAYYDPSANKMAFPAAILQPPFYSAKQIPPVADYARIGMVMGHELTHGFDDQGRNFDAQGSLRKWWSQSVDDEFNTRAQCISNQYSNFEVYSQEGEYLGHVNGNLTLGENIADNGGLRLAYMAYQLFKDANNISLPSQDDVTEDDKLFFVSFAQQWCEKRTAAYSEFLLTADPHSPGKWRVNGPLMNLERFAKTYKCREGSFMNPSNKCIVW